MGTRNSGVSDAPIAGTLRAGRYAVIGVLGAGSQAETFDAVDKQAGKAVAIKRFQVRGAKSWKDVELAEREARVLATLSHPNLPVYVEHFEEDGALYLVMEKIEGETLSALRRRKAGFSHDEVAQFLRDADSVLGYLHSRAPAIIHRDIKPGNVIRRVDGSFAFVDFGSVRDQLKPEGGSTVVGTFGYMAPEQFQGRSLPGSDVYAVGATALALVTGREPEELPHHGLAIDVSAALGRGAEPWLVRALSAMLEPDPDKRASRVPAPGSGRRAPSAPRTTGTAAAYGEAAATYADAVFSNPGDFRAIRDQGRELRRKIKDENKNLRRELKAQVRDETRRVRREVRSFQRSRRDHRQRQRHGFGPAAPLLIAGVMLALTVARLGTWALFRVFLPTLLAFLSLFFGRPLRRAAYRCREVGMDGDLSLQHAMRLVRGRMLGREIEVEVEELDGDSPAPTTRSRVSEPPDRVPSEAEDLADFDEKLSEHARRESR
jgi:tRNA A-37 threonylcarbamoyl transferase component Bud32